MIEVDVHAVAASAQIPNLKNARSFI